MGTRTVYLETMGCQMNVLDSELVLGQLRRLGYAATTDPQSADVVLLNTCSVRDHAEQKVLSRLGSLRRPKERRPEMVIGVLGCMAERDPEGIFRRMPHVDLVCGPGELNKVPAMIEQVQASRQRAIALAQSMSRRNTPLDRALEYDSVEALDLSRDPAPDENVLQSYIRVQRGCDKFCTFCVVPFTRGPERSRPPHMIVEEAKMLADRGCREVTLIGQTVNSYVHPEDGRAVTFADLLARVQEVPGIERVRFTTSYPGDFSDDIFYAMRDLPKVCEYLHIPAQSGSDRILARMRRQYSVQQYIELMDRARLIVPDIALAGDFIVGFCGETQEDHEATLRLVERVRYKNIFVFKYSPRPGTVAFKRDEDDVADEIKRQRNYDLLNLQAAIALDANRTMIGTTVEVLVEGYSKAAVRAQSSDLCRDGEGAGGNGARVARDDAAAPANRQSTADNRQLPAGDDVLSIPLQESEQSRGQEIGWRRSDQLVGRTRQDQIVVFSGRPEDIGTFARVRVTGVTALTLHGTLVEHAAHSGSEAADAAVSLPLVI